MTDFAALPVEKLLNRTWSDCPCGRPHATDVRYLKIGRGAVNALPEALAALNCRHPFLVCDLNTLDAAGSTAIDALRAAGLPHTLCAFHTRDRLNPAEWELGSLTLRFDPACDVIVGVGGGVINDLCKLLGRAARRPTAIVATAPSMDGLASNSGAMEVGGIKKTLYTPSPTAVICDTEIMAKAPRRMLLAGIGDMIAKHTSLCDWRVSNLVNSEYYCPAVADMMRAALRRTLQNLDGILARDPDAVGAMAEGLVLAGIAMSFARVSRPASGLEHCFSHIWEMMALERKRPYDLHGLQVGVGTALALPVYRWAMTLRPCMDDVEAAIARFDEAAWADDLRRVFGSAAAPLIEQEKTMRKNAPDGRRRRARNIIAHWDEILAILREELPAPDFLDKMHEIGLPMRPRDIGISDQDALDAFLCTRDIRDRYLFSSLLWDIGQLTPAADILRTTLSTQ